MEEDGERGGGCEGLPARAVLDGRRGGGGAQRSVEARPRAVDVPVHR